MPSTAKTIALTYFDAWDTRDFDRLRTIFADDVTFTGPMATVEGADACLQGLEGLRGMLERIEVLHVFEDGDDVVTWLHLHKAGTDPMPVANWSHVEDGKVTRVRVTFDPRPLLG
jgi:ketosteroid isomerase-like protein